MPSESSEQPLPSPEETAKTPEIINIDNLPERLGFIETEEMRRLRLEFAAVAITRDLDQFEALMIQYHVLSEALVDEKQGVDYARAQIGVSVATAVIRRDTGRRRELYLEDLDEALYSARQMGFVDVVPSLERAIADIERTSDTSIEQLNPSHEIAEVLRRIGKEYGFDDETCAEIAVMSFEEAFETAYGYLLQAGLDADVILASFIE